MTGGKRNFIAVPSLILWLGFGALGLAWLGFFLVDMLDIFGMGTALYQAMEDPGHLSPWVQPWLWVTLFKEGGPIEVLQWLFLASASGISFHLHGRISAWGMAGKDTGRVRLFWLLMGIAFLLMLIEDSGNVRHLLRHLMEASLGTTAKSISELMYFAALGAVPLSALVFFGRPALRLPRTRIYLLGGFFLYALAAAGSATRYQWYDKTGMWLHENVFQEALKVVQVGNLPHGFVIMDYLLEESLELAAAAMLAAAAASFMAEWKTPSPS